MTQSVALRVRAADVGAHSPTRRVRWGVLAALSFLALGARPAAGQLSVDQAEIVIRPQAVTPSTLGFSVLNGSGNVVEAQVYMMDWDRDLDGGNEFKPQGTVPQSCAKYLKVFPLSLRLPAHASQSVRLAVQGTDSLPATCWSIVFVEVAGPRATTGREISYRLRLGVKVYIEPVGLALDGEVEGMRIDTIRGRAPNRTRASDTSATALVFRNTGGLPAMVRGDVEYRRLDNSVAAHDSIPSFPVLPGASRRVRLALPRLPTGHYVVLALLDFGGNDVAAGQIPLDVP